MRIQHDGRIELVADQLNPPITDLLWHKGRLYIFSVGRCQFSMAIGSWISLPVCQASVMARTIN